MIVGSKEGVNPFITLLRTAFDLCSISMMINGKQQTDKKIFFCLLENWSGTMKLLLLVIATFSLTKAAPSYNYTILNEFYHDSNAFTEGLFYDDTTDLMFESLIIIFTQINVENLQVQGNMANQQSAHNS